MSDGKGKSRKRRVINSCQFCRSKKLKCEKQKPECSTCVKLKIECLYYDTIEVKDSYNIDQQIRELTQKLELLVAEKQKTNINNDETSSSKSTTPSLASLKETCISFYRPLSLFSLFQKDKYLNCLIRNTRSGNDVPETITQELEREKRQSSNMDLIKIDLYQRQLSLYDLIREHLNQKQFNYLIMNFFESELYINFPIISKDQFLTSLNSFLINGLPEFVKDPSDYLLLGQLLLILRISSLSFFNCGYPTGWDEEYSVSEKVIYLAELCLDEIRKPLHNSTLEYLQLSLLLEYYKLYSPDSVASIDDMISLDISKLVRIASISGYSTVKYIENGNDEKDKVNNIKAIIWLKLVELDYTKFLNDGTPLSLNEEYYSTMLPSSNLDTGVLSLDHIITKSMRQRAQIFPLVSPFSRMLNSVKTPPNVNQLETNLDLLVQYIQNTELEHLLRQGSRTIEERSLKSVKFSNLIDLCCLNFMVSIHTLLTPTVGKDVEDRMMGRVMVSLNVMLKLTYFLDVTQRPAYNLHKQFGLNFQLIPKILQAQHRAFQFQLSLMIRTHYHFLGVGYRNLSGIPEYYHLERLKDCSTNNIKIMLINFGRISKSYVYSKRLQMMQTFMVLKNFGVQINSISSTQLISFLQSADIPMNIDSNQQQLLEICQGSLLELNGLDTVVSHSTLEFQSRVGELEIFLSQNGLNSSAIDQLESFLDQEVYGPIYF